MARLKMTHIDNGFYSISEKNAKKLAGGKLPRPGYEKQVVHEGKKWWLARTFIYEGEEFVRKQVWSIRSAEPLKFGPFPLDVR